MRIKSRVKETKKEIIVKKACVLVSDENQNNFFIFDTDDTNIRFGTDSAEIVMWFKDTRPFDRYNISGVKPHNVKIFLSRNDTTPIITYELERGYFSYLGFYNLIIKGEITYFKNLKINGEKNVLLRSSRF